MSKRIWVQLVKTTKIDHDCYGHGCEQRIEKGVPHITVSIKLSRLPFPVLRRFHDDCFMDWVRYTRDRVRQPGRPHVEPRPDRLERRAALARRRRKLAAWDSIPEAKKKSLFISILNIDLQYGLKHSPKLFEWDMALDTYNELQKPASGIDLPIV